MTKKREREEVSVQESFMGAGESDVEEEEGYENEGELAADLQEEMDLVESMMLDKDCTPEQMLAAHNDIATVSMSIIKLKHTAENIQNFKNRLTAYSTYYDSIKGSNVKMSQEQNIFYQRNLQNLHAYEEELKLESTPPAKRQACSEVPMLPFLADAFFAPVELNLVTQYNEPEEFSLPNGSVAGIVSAVVDFCMRNDYSTARISKAFNKTALKVSKEALEAEINLYLVDVNKILMSPDYPSGSSSFTMEQNEEYHRKLAPYKPLWDKKCCLIELLEIVGDYTPPSNDHDDF